jgi:hypothetical protein
LYSSVVLLSVNLVRDWWGRYFFVLFGAKVQKITAIIGELLLLFFADVVYIQA